MSDDDLKLGNAAMLILLTDACAAAGSQRAWARKHGFSDAYVSDVLAGKRDISEAVANALGYLRRVRFHKIAKGTGDAS